MEWIHQRVWSKFGLEATTGARSMYFLLVSGFPAFFLMNGGKMEFVVELWLGCAREYAMSSAGRVSFGVLRRMGSVGILFFYLWHRGLSSSASQ